MVLAEIHAAGNTAAFEFASTPQLTPIWPAVPSEMKARDQFGRSRCRLQRRPRDDDGELRDEEQRVGRLRGVVQLAARSLGKLELNTPDEFCGAVGQLGLRPRPVVDAERARRVLRRPVLMRRQSREKAPGIG
jgi:hypothetical protein